QPQFLVGDAGAGVKARFLADGRVAFRARRAGTLRMLTVDHRGAVRAAAQARLPAFEQNDRIYVRTANGIVSAASGDRFFAPVISPDGNRVAFEGLTTGIYVYDIAAASLTYVGIGTAPSWGADSKTLVYERTEDDGHFVVASDLWMWQAGGETRALTTTDARIERRPALSPDGKKVAFDDDRGTVFVAPLEVTP
ncbi:MAG TPA: hypothetical protein VFG83_04670, partial [Kofleriaceae bacterium]|nr:hypothetical protein [Kofleriaceae bacterium]